MAAEEVVLADAVHDLVAGGSLVEGLDGASGKRDAIEQAEGLERGGRQRRVGREPNVDALRVGADLRVGLDSTGGGVAGAGQELGELAEAVAHGSHGRTQ